MRGRWLRRAALIVAAGVSLAGPGTAAETDLASLVEPYLQARRGEALGVVAARAYVEPTRPGAAPAPQPAVSIVLLPYSAEFDAELGAVKAGLRNSIDTFVQAVGRIESARVDYERALVAAGAGELVRSEATDAQGAVEMTGLPAGDWLLLAWHEGGHLSKHHKIRDQDAKRYPDIPSTVTYSTVTYWRARITVRKGETAEVSMTDRSVWMTAPRQEGGSRPPKRR